MRLYTVHGQDFFLDQGHVDHSKSEYYCTVAGVPCAYRELHKRIGTSQVIWCELDRADTPPSKVQWEIEVPECAIITFVDNLVWNKILHRRCQLPHSLYVKLYTRALDQEPHDSERTREVEARLTEEFWDSLGTGQELWDRLLLEAPPGDTGSASALIRHPVPPEWVIGRLYL